MAVTLQWGRAGDAIGSHGEEAVQQPTQFLAAGRHVVLWPLETDKEGLVEGQIVWRRNVGRAG